MNIKEIKELVRILDGTDIVEFSFENEGHKILIKKGSGQFVPATVPIVNPAVAPTMVTAAPSQAVPATAPAEEKKDELGPNQVVITAPMVGTFYQAPSPDAEAYVQIGQTVEPGQVVCIIEAMKLMNEIESEYRGKVVDILVKNAQPVEYGQPLFILEKL